MQKKLHIEPTHKAISITWIRYRLYAILLLLSIGLIALKSHFELPFVKTAFYQNAEQTFSNYSNRYRAPYLERQVYTIQQRGGFVPLLQSLGLSETLIYKTIIPILSQQVSTELLPAQTEISITMRHGGSLEEPILQSLSIAKDKQHDLTITRENGNYFTLAVTPRLLYHKYMIVTYGGGPARLKIATIRSENGAVPEPIRTDFTKIMRFSPLMQTIKYKHPHVTILYDASIDRNNLIAHYGPIEAIDLQINTVHKVFYRFLDHEGRVGYYDNKGYIIPELLFHRPVPIQAPISSPFGWRMHPILHRLIKHEGVDFAVPINTPIRAAAAGIIKMQQRYGGFGLYVRIDHKNNALGYQTEYAHLSQFAPNLRVSDHVKMGQIIGYSGSSGLSTGPHLHFGLIWHRQRINPLKKILIHKALTGKDLKNFNHVINLYNKQLKKLATFNFLPILEVASNQNTHKVLE